MNRIKISTAQFENHSGDKEYNLGVIEKLAGKAALQGSQVIAFHECSVTGYTFARNLSKQQMLDLAEFIPDGETVSRLKHIAEKNDALFLEIPEHGGHVGFIAFNKDGEYWGETRAVEFLEGVR